MRLLQAGIAARDNISGTVSQSHTVVGRQFPKHTQGRLGVGTYRLVMQGWWSVVMEWLTLLYYWGLLQVTKIVCIKF